MSAPSTQTTPALTAAERATQQLNDFSDRLPPMLVKELRQGMRARTFVGVFLGLQLFLGIVMLFATAAAGYNSAGSTVSQIIFLFFSLAVLVVQPLRAMNALHVEIKSTTIDMMVLTRLDARRIVMGKWASIVGQTLLLFVSIIPYLILRYFFGGMNLFAELLALASVFLCSACLTAINVGFSANSAIIIRGILPLGLGVFMFSMCFALIEEFDDIVQFLALDKVESVAIYLGLIIGSLYLAWLIMGLAISTIAPASENHSTLNRLVTLSTMALAGVILYFANATPEIAPWIIGAIACPAIMIAITEKPGIMARLTLPFVRKGVLGRIAGRFLYPCWSSGIHFAALLCLITVSVASYVFLISSTAYDDKQFIAICSLAGCLLFPALVLSLFQKRIQNYLGIYLAILIGSVCGMFALVAIAESTRASEALWIFCWMPPMQLFMLASSTFSDDETFLVSTVTTGIYLVLLLWRAWHSYTLVSHAERECLETYFEETTDSSA